MTTQQFEQTLPPIRYSAVQAGESGSDHGESTCIFAYEDYREFLQKRFTELHSRDALFSQRRLARESGILNPGFFNEVIRGRRRLNPSSALKFAHGLRLGEPETEFLISLVEWAECRNPAAKRLAEKRLMKLKAKNLFQGSEPENGLKLSKELFAELLNHWTAESTHFALQTLDVSNPIFPLVDSKTWRASIESLMVIREMAADAASGDAGLKDRVFQISLLIKPKVDAA